jgi:tetratricopeptide (TPR) repeat protein
VRISRAVSPLIVCLMLRSTTTVLGQGTDWDRFIANGDAAMAKQQYMRAEESYRQASKFAESHWKRDARIPSTLIKLSGACSGDGKKGEAEMFASQAVSALEDALKAHKPQNASDELQQADVSTWIYDKAGDIFAADQNFPEAENMYKKVRAIRQKYASERPASAPNNEDIVRFIVQNVGNAQAKLADSEEKLGQLYLKERKLPDAEQEFQNAEIIREKLLGSDQPPLVPSLNNLAMCYALQGQYDQAEPLYNRAVTILERSKYQPEPEMAVALENYGLLLKKMGRDADAKVELDKARDIRSKLSNTQR